MKMTLEKLESLHPCADGLEFAKKCDGDFTSIWQTCDRGDWLIWLLGRCNLLKKKLAVKIAIECAKRVLSNHEKKYPEDLRPRQAIEAAEKWLKSPTAKNKNAASAASAAYSAAYSAYSAASAAAYAAYSAAYSAYAAYSAAYSAYSAASAAAYAAYCAASADAAADADAERKWQADKIREIVGKNPFKK
jgi:hypothetical protein